jgi:hypothetical protein
MDGKPKAGFRPSLIVGAVLVLLVIYVLASGPLTWLQIHGYLPDPVANCIGVCYLPLWHAADLVGAGDLLMDYLSLFGME